VIDRNLRYLIAEGAMIEKLGYSREQLEGHTVTTSVFFIAASGYILQREATFSN
jgi:hypothetical protein